MTGRLTLAMIMVAAHLGIAGVGPIHGQSGSDGMNDFELRSHESPDGVLPYRLHVPTEWAGERRLVVMLHGCLQDAADFAAGSAMVPEAESNGFAVLFPQQDPANNPQRCWNWFVEAQQQVDGPEVLRIVSLIDAVIDEHGVDPESVDLAGISAGAAMANILAVTHPARFRRVALHSGIAWGAASNIGEGIAAMQSAGPETIALDDARLDALKASHRPEGVLVIQGGADASVAPVNGVRTADRWATFFEMRGETLDRNELEAGSIDGTRVSGAEWVDSDGTVRIVRVEIDDLPHAWSGGDAAGSFTSPDHPSATRMILEFFGIGR